MYSEIVTVAGQQYRKAAWPRRIAARLIDILVVIAVCAIAGENLLVLTVPLSIIYLLLGNGFLRGQSLGKRLSVIKVIDATHGRQCSVIQELVRQRYLFFTSPLFLALNAFDSAQGCFDKPELYVVRTSQFTPEEREAMREKPAKLDLAGMRNT